MREHQSSADDDNPPPQSQRAFLLFFCREPRCTLAAALYTHAHTNSVMHPPYLLKSIGIRNTCINQVFDRNKHMQYRTPPPTALYKEQFTVQNISRLHSDFHFCQFLIHMCLYSGGERSRTLMVKPMDQFIWKRSFFSTVISTVISKEMCLYYSFISHE